MITWCNAMSTLDAWRKVFSLSSGDWVRIPESLRAILSLPHGLGIMGSVLCTQASAIGITRLVNRLNSIMEREK